MSSGFNKIESKNFIQVILTMLFAVFVILICLFYLSQRNKLNELVHEIEELGDYSERLKYNTQALIDISVIDREFIQSGNNSYTSNYFNLVGKINDFLDSLYTDPRIGRNEIMVYHKDTLKLVLDNYNKEFTTLYLYFQQKGNISSGFSRNIYNHSNDIINKSVGYDSLLILLSRLKTNEIEYLITPSFNSYNRINDEIEQYKEACLSMNPNLDADIEMQSSELIEAISLYQDKIRDLHDRNKRLGAIGEGDTFISKLYTAESGYIQQFSEFEFVVKDHVNSLVNNLNYIALIIVLLLTLVYITMFVIYLNRLNYNIKGIIRALNYLVKGNINAIKTNKYAPFEFRDINLLLSNVVEIQDKRRLFVDDILEHNFNDSFKSLSEQDAMGKSLLKLLDHEKRNQKEQQRHKEENELRRYINEGLAKFGDILRNNNDNLEQLCFEFIKSAVKYLGAIQGGVFIINDEDDERIDLIAAYAYNRRRYLQRSLRLGDGLVGTCAREKQKIILDNLPNDYIEITSGLGDAPPDHLMLLPCMHEETIIGVIELTSLNKYKKHEIELGEQISSSLASILISVRSNEKTAALLKKSQVQAAEMLEQEEEMRQNMEELKATQEESSRREEEFMKVVKSVENSFFVIEYDNKGLITRINEK
ncbi:MAG: GAF domain-containing protein, partial [Bacteroidales bacterium]|nr:GAF domain-containing protein [Bacteroidales bacterium]